MQLLRLRSTIRRHHPPQRAVLSQICCFGQRKVVLFQILLDGAKPHGVGTTWLFSPVCWREANRIHLASALSSMRIICPNRVSRHDWILAVSLGCFVMIAPNKLVPFDAKQHTQTPLVMCINLTCVHYKLGCAYLHS